MRDSFTVDDYVFFFGLLFVIYSIHNSIGISLFAYCIVWFPIMLPKHSNRDTCRNMNTYTYPYKNRSNLATQMWRQSTTAHCPCHNLYARLYVYGVHVYFTWYFIYDFIGKLIRVKHILPYKLLCAMLCVHVCVYHGVYTPSCTS